MAPYLFWELMSLVVGVWLMVVVFVVYGWLLLKRQKQMFMQMMQGEASEAKPAEPNEEQPVRLEISRDEPIAKYANFVPGENVDVSFVDKKE